MHWTQNYAPFDSLWPDPLLAALPVIVLLGLLATGRVPAVLAARRGCSAQLSRRRLCLAERGIAAGWARASRLGCTVLVSSGYGALLAYCPSAGLCLQRFFFTRSRCRPVNSRSSSSRCWPFPTIGASSAADCILFRSVCEGAAGFGTPVAISAAHVGRGRLKPLHAAGLAAIANTALVAYGALGTPIITLARVTGLDELKLSQMAGRQLPFFS